MQVHELPVYSPRKQRLKKMRGFLRKVHSACGKNQDYPEYAQGDWCDFAHIHLDWHGRGDYSRHARRLFLEGYAKRFDQYAKMFIRQKVDFQLWIMIHPHDSGADCLFFHTPNPQSEFPVKLSTMNWSAASEHLFTKLLPHYEIIEGQANDRLSLAYYARGVGVPLK